MVVNLRESVSSASGKARGMDGLVVNAMEGDPVSVSVSVYG